MRRPVPVATLSALFLIVLGLPFFGIKFNTVDPTVLPKSASARQAYDTVSDEFPPYRETPIWIDLEGGRPKAAAQFAAQVRGVDGVAEVAAAAAAAGRRHGDPGRSPPTPSPPSASQATVKRIRDLRPPPGATALVGGATADFVDFQSSLARHLPIALAIIVVATLMILFLMTGSVILPIKSLIMNFLNLSAVFGLLVLIFQDGRLEGLLDYSSPGAIEQTMPILLFAVAFGLSTDYAVFLLSRIKEARDNGASDSECVAIGLERTGRIVTAAALLFAVAMGAFATSQIIFIKENGVGTALAVLIDASIIRALLVPSLMELLGKWNWWAPAPLRRLHDRFGISEAATAEQAGARVRAAGRLATGRSATVDSSGEASKSERFEPGQRRFGRVAERFEAEQFLDAAQEGEVVVVGVFVDRAGSDVGRDQQHPDLAAAAGRFDRPGGGRFGARRRRRRRQVRVFGGGAAGAGVGFGARLGRLVEGDRDQAAFVLVGGRGGDLGHDRFEEAFGGGQAGGLFGRAGRFAAVVAGVGDDVGEGRACFSASFRSGGELVESSRFVTVVDDGFAGLVAEARRSRGRTACARRRPPAVRVST